MLLRVVMLFGLCLCLATAAGCSVAVRGQEIYARTDPRTDSAQLLVIYKGITATDEKESTVAKAVDELAPYTSGQRRVRAYGTWDLDEAAASDSDELADVAAHVQLAGHGFFVDDEERLCAWQDFQIDNLQYVVRCLNDLISRNVEEEHGAAEVEDINAGKKEEEHDDDDEDFDARTAELWLARARSGAPWFWLGAGELVVDLPMSEGYFDRMRGIVIDEMTENGKPDDDLCQLLAQHLMYLVGMTFEHERLVMRFSVPGDRPVRLVLDSDKRDVFPQLREALEASGVHVDPSLTIEDVRARAK